MKSQLAELVLTCGSWQEAQNIADNLLENKLVACVEFMEIKSKYRWADKVDKANEIKLVMLSEVGKFKDIEAIVAKLHSYDTFVLQALPLAQVSDKATTWLSKELNG